MSLITALNPGLTGILAQQKQVEITGNNIANVNTPGYSRQKATLTPNAAIQIHGLLMGQGVKVEDVAREYDKFVTGQLVDQNDALGRESAKSSPLAELERIFGIGEDSLASDIESFFGAWHDLSQNPSGAVEREQVIYKGDNLLDAFDQIESDLVVVNQHINDTLNAKVNGINLKLQELAELNTTIKQKESLNHVASLDQDRRDLLVKELSKTLGVKTFETGSGQIGAQLPGGLPLVQGGNAVAFQSYYEGGRLELQVRSGDITLPADGTNFGGEIKGLLDVRDELVPELEERVGELRYSIIAQVNARHEAGCGLDGQTGRAFFTRFDSYQSQNGFADPADLSFNAGTLDIIINDTETTSIAIEQGENSLLGIRDAINNADAGVLASITEDAAGFHLDLTPVQPGAGVRLDATSLTTEEAEPLLGSFTETVNGVFESDNLFDDPEALSLDKGSLSVDVAGTVTNVSIGEGDNSLSGIRDAINDSGAAVSASIEPDGGGYRLVLTAEAVDDDITVDASGLADTDYALNSLELVSGTDEVAVAIRDTRQIAAAGVTAGAPGDNENALAIHSLVDEPLVEGDKTFVDGYGRIASRVGTETRRNTMARDGAADAMNQLENLRESIVGVSVEEEMINLIMFQKGFEASSQYIQTIDEMLGTIIGMRR
jgi:flagellar hook-associated protein 1 FlgK